MKLLQLIPPTCLLPASRTSATQCLRTHYTCMRCTALSAKPSCNELSIRSRTACLRIRQYPTWDRQLRACKMARPPNAAALRCDRTMEEVVEEVNGVELRCARTCLLSTSSAALKPLQCSFFSSRCQSRSLFKPNNPLPMVASRHSSDSDLQLRHAEIRLLYGVAIDVRYHDALQTVHNELDTWHQCWLRCISNPLSPAHRAYHRRAYLPPSTPPMTICNKVCCSFWTETFILIHVWRTQ